MKKLLALSLLASVSFFMIGADLRQPPAPVKQVKKVCVGYTIIEAGKGIDCNGDTLKLVKSGGFYIVAPANNAIPTAR